MLVNNSGQGKPARRIEVLAARPDPPQWMLPIRRLFDSFTIYAGDLKKGGFVQ